MKAIIFSLLFGIFLFGCHSADEEGFVNKEPRREAILKPGFLYVVMENWVTMDTAFAFFNRENLPIDTIDNYKFERNYDFELELYDKDYIVYWDYYYDTCYDCEPKLYIRFKDMNLANQQDWLLTMQENHAKEVESFDHLYTIKVEEGTEEAWSEKLIREKYVDEVFLVYDYYWYY